MSNPRQQRTNYSRQKTKSGAPPVRNNIKWQFDAMAGDQITLLIEGSESGLVENGVPEFEILATAIVATASSLVAGVLTLTMSAAPSAPCILALQTPSTALRNQFGGLLNSGFCEIPPPPPPPIPTTPSYSNHSGYQLDCLLTDGGPDYFSNASLSLYNSTKSEYSTSAIVSGDHLYAEFPSAIDSGDSIDLPSTSSAFRNSQGGGLYGTSILVP